jgi:hypothetical protein
MVVLYFFPMFIVIAFLARRVARGGSSAPKPNRFQLMAWLLAVIALGILAFWLVGAMGR